MVTIKYSSPKAIKEHNYFVFVTLVTRQLTVFSNKKKTLQMAHSDSFQQAAGWAVSHLYFMRGTIRDHGFSRAMNSVV